MCLCSGDKPLTDALELMNNEGITSLPVIDSQNNVIGNISHVDVRVSVHQISMNEKMLMDIASHKEHGTSFTPLLLYPFHISDSFRAWRQRRKRLLSCLPRKSILHARTYNSQISGYEITSVKKKSLTSIIFKPS